MYNSAGSLMYLVENLRKTLMTDLARGERMPFQGLPVVIILAHNPGLSERDLQTLREDGAKLADR